MCIIWAATASPPHLPLGKSAVRVDAPGVHHLGPHFFSGEPSPRWQTQVCWVLYEYCSPGVQPGRWLLLAFGRCAAS